MIIDYKDNAGKYASLIPNLMEGMQLVETILEKENGRYEGENGIFASVQSGTTGDISGNLFETHEKYLDVQILLAGRENMNWEEISRLKEAEPYNKEKDLHLFRGTGKEITITEGMFYILFPQDAHRCGGKVAAEGGTYRKIVLKLPVR